MRIQMISFLGSGGIIIYAAQLCNELSNENNLNLILPSYFDKSHLNPKIGIYSVNAPRNVILSFILSFNLYAYSKIIKHISKNNPDIIHILSSHPWNAIICILCRNSNIVFTLHDPIYHESNITKKIIQIPFQLSDWLAIKIAKKIIVHGNTLKDICLKKGVPEEKIEVVTHGDFSYYTKIARNQIETAEEKNRERINVLFFGRIEPYKGLEYFIQASEKIFKFSCNISFIIAGDGDLKVYKKFIKNPSIFTIFNYYLNDDEISSLFQKADLVVLPYISATQSGIIPLAYAFKKPVIVTRVGALPEVVDDGITGFVVPPKDVDALVRAINTLVNDDKLRKEMGENAYKKMKRELSWDIIAKKHLEIYRRTLKKNKDIMSDPTPTIR